MAKKWADPLDRLLEADEKANSVKKYLEDINKKEASSPKKANKINTASNLMTIQEVDVKKILRWKYKDRPENELGDIEELAETFKSVGQQQPCIVRESQKHPGKLELIVGERRWRAAEIAGIKLKVIIQNIDDKIATLIQAVENEKRSNLSDFAKGMSYADKIEKKLITQKDLTEILNISKQQVTRLLSYKKIPIPLFDAINDFRKVSARTAYELVRLANKGDQHLQSLIDMAEKIREGKYGQKRIEKELEKSLKKTKNIISSNKKILSSDGRHLFTWRLDNNVSPSIHFPKDILKLITDGVVDFENITEEFKACIEKKLISLNFGQSPRGD